MDLLLMEDLLPFKRPKVPAKGASDSGEAAMTLGGRLCLSQSTTPPVGDRRHAGAYPW